MDLCAVGLLLEMIDLESRPGAAPKRGLLAACKVLHDNKNQVSVRIRTSSSQRKASGDGDVVRFGWSAFETALENCLKAGEDGVELTKEWASIKGLLPSIADDEALRRSRDAKSIIAGFAELCDDGHDESLLKFISKVQAHADVQVLDEGLSEAMAMIKCAVEEYRRGLDAFASEAVIADLRAFLHGETEAETENAAASVAGGEGTVEAHAAPNRTRLELLCRFFAFYDNITLAKFGATRDAHLLTAELAARLNIVGEILTFEHDEGSDSTMQEAKLRMFARIWPTHLSMKIVPNVAFRDAPNLQILKDVLREESVRHTMNKLCFNYIQPGASPAPSTALLDAAKEVQGALPDECKQRIQDGIVFSQVKNVVARIEKGEKVLVCESARVRTEGAEMLTRNPCAAVAMETIETYWATSFASFKASASLVGCKELHGELTHVASTIAEEKYSDLPWLHEDISELPIGEKMKRYKSCWSRARTAKSTGETLVTTLSGEEATNVQSIVDDANFVEAHSEDIAHNLATISLAQVLVCKPRRPSFRSDLQRTLTYATKALTVPKTSLPGPLQKLLVDAEKTKHSENSVDASSGSKPTPKEPEVPGSASSSKLTDVKVEAKSSSEKKLKRKCSSLALS